MPACLISLASSNFHPPFLSIVLYSTSRIVGWSFDGTFPKDANSSSSEGTDKKAEFNENILAGTCLGFVRHIVWMTDVVRNEKDYGKSNVGVRFKFFYNGSAFVRLLMQNDRAKCQAF